MFRRELRHPGLDALQATIDELALRERWRELPPGGWVPEADATALELTGDRGARRRRSLVTWP